VNTNSPDNQACSPSMAAMVTPTTWKELRQALPADLSQSAAEEIRLLTAGERHRARRDAAAAAALAWVDGRIHGQDAPDRLTLAAGICAAEALGLYGGGRGNPGAATLRHPAFQALGSGRRQARDGAAWTAAIEAATTAVFPEWLRDDTTCSWTETPEGAPALRVWDGREERFAALALFVRYGALNPEESVTLLRHCWRAGGATTPQRAAAYSATLAAIEAKAAELAAEEAAKQAAAEAADSLTGGEL